MSIRQAATLTAATLLLVSCGSGPTLTDAQLLWCMDDQDPVVNAQEQLELKSYVEVWRDREDGIERATAISDEAGNIFAWLDVAYAEWLEHPDGIRSCIAAYDSR